MKLNLLQLKKMQRRVNATINEYIIDALTIIDNIMYIC